jgi:ribosomal protein S19
MVLVEFVEVKISQVVVGNLLGEHVVDRYQDLVGHGHGGPFVAAPGFER